MSREDRKLKKHFEEKRKYHQKKLLEQKREPLQSLPEGLVTQVGAGQCVVLADSREIACRYSGAIATGDRVTFSEARQRVDTVLPRRTILSRPDPANPLRQRVIAANMDLVMPVVSMADPPLRPGLLDRMLVAIQRGGAKPLVCVNKLDLGGGPTEWEVIRYLQNSGVPVVPCSAKTGEGVGDLLNMLAGTLTVVAGHSGVGKSSLLNALAGEQRAATGAVSEAHHRGKHTTTGSSLHRLPNGALLIDTPGVREFGLWDADPADILAGFPDVAAHATNCGYRDCSHTHEPRCGVKNAVQEGLLSEGRYQAYRKLLD